MPAITCQLPYKPRRWQSKAHKGLLEAHRGLLICSRQIGKTWAARCELVERSMQGPPNSDCCYLAPAQTQARKIFWPHLKEYLRPMAEFVEFRETELCAVLPGNRRIYLLGAESGENIRGSSFHTIICDERDSISDLFWREVMLPTLNAYQDDSFVLYIGTLSGGDSTLWRMYKENKDHPDWYCSVVTAEESGVFSDEWLAEQRAVMGEGPYLREMMCDPVAPVENSVIGREVADAEREGRIMSYPARNEVPVLSSWDLGIRDATSVWLYQLHGRWIEYIAYREYTEMGVADVVRELLQEFPRATWGEATLPHDAKNRGKEFGTSVEDIFADSWPGGYHVFQSGPNPISTLQAVRTNMPRCRFEEQGCEMGIMRLKSASFVLTPKTGAVTDNILHDDNSHALDAFRYGLWRVESLHPRSSEDAFPHIAGRHVSSDYDELQSRYFE